MFFVFIISSIFHSLQLKVVRMKNNIQLPLFSHITRIPQRSELREKWLERFNIREGCTFRHHPGNKGDKDQEPAKVEIVALILLFAAV
jgi:hypothetical protein